MQIIKDLKIPLIDIHDGIVNKQGIIGKKIFPKKIFIDKTGMIRAIWRNPEDLRDHPADIWEFIQKEKKA